MVNHLFFLEVLVMVPFDHRFHYLCGFQPSPRPWCVLYAVCPCSRWGGSLQMFWGFPTFETKHLMYITRYLNSIVYGCIYTRTYLSYFIIKFIIWPILTKLFGRRSLDAHFSMHGAQICRCRRVLFFNTIFVPKLWCFPKLCLFFLARDLDSQSIWIKTINHPINHPI